MVIRLNRFNLYLFLSLAAAVACGCHTPVAKHKDKKVLATLRLHQEVNFDPMGSTEVATVHRDPLVTMTIRKEYFLSEANVKQASVIDTMGGFALSIQFDRQGSWLLEQYTAASRGRHIAIFSQFAAPKEAKLNDGHWLAAPKILNHITDGLFVFTADVTREEAEQIALGLNNVAREVQDPAPGE